MKNNSPSWLETQILSNTVEAYLYCLILIVFGIVIAQIADKLLLRLLRKLASKTENTWDDFVLNTLERLLLPTLYGLILFIGLRDLNMTPALAKVMHLAITVFIAVQGVRLLLTVFSEMLERLTLRPSGSGIVTDQEKRGIRGIIALVKIVIWSLAFILVLDNLGVKVSTFVAGLGISGIAVALAAHAVLGDLFSYFVIFLDKPFQVGHSIKVGNHQGDVESIGLKTTRIRSLSGEQIVLSNKYLTDNQILNYKVMTRRRSAFLFDVKYSTPESALREIPKIIREILIPFSDASFERAHLKEFVEFGIRFETVFFVESSDYDRYMDIRHEVFLILKTRLEKMGVAFAIPSHSVVLRE